MVKLIGLFIFLPSKSQTFVFHPVESVISHVVVWRQRSQKEIDRIAITPSALLLPVAGTNVFFWADRLGRLVSDKW